MWYVRKRTAAVRSVGDLGVRLSTADDGRRVGAGLQGTSDIGPNQAGNGSVHQLSESGVGLGERKERPQRPLVARQMKER
jgi:hypothetical protein